MWPAFFAVVCRTAIVTPNTFFSVRVMGPVMAITVNLTVVYQPGCLTRLARVGAVGGWHLLGEHRPAAVLDA